MEAGIMIRNNPSSKVNYGLIQYKIYSQYYWNCISWIKLSELARFLILIVDYER